MKDLLAFYRLADNARDETAWSRLLQLLDGVGPATARRVIDRLDLDRDDPLSRWDGGLLPETSRPAAAKLISAPAERTDRAEVLEDALAPLIRERSTGADAVPPSVDEDWLVLSTVHSAKGLEWDAVHLPHATDGSFPSDMAVSTAGAAASRRRRGRDLRPHRRAGDPRAGAHGEGEERGCRDRGRRPGCPVGMKRSTACPWTRSCSTSTGRSSTPRAAS